MQGNESVVDINLDTMEPVDTNKTGFPVNVDADF
jgi:hypothetical protein